MVWLVPSLTILEQTVKNLANIDHPYRQRLNDLFQGRVQVYEKTDVLQGAGFNFDTMREQLSVVVMSFDSLKATNRENRKAYQENGYLVSFLNDTTHDAVLLPEYDKWSLINVIRTLNPVVVGLNKAGFSKRDYREVDMSKQGDLLASANQEPTEAITDELLVDTTQLNPNWEA